MDPSKTGYFEFAPTTIPVLERIDVIEEAELPFAEITQPTAEDLIPQSMEYRLAPSDVVRVEIYELLESNMNDISVLIVDQAGQIRIKTLGNIPAAGLTLEELKQEIVNRVKATIDEPLVSVSLEQGRAYEYTIYGAVNGTGVYSISRDDFRVMDALALSGGTIASTMNIYVIRELPLTDLVKPEYNRGTNRSPQGSAATQPRAPEPEPDRDNSVDIESLIQNLENSGGSSGGSSSPGMVSRMPSKWSIWMTLTPKMSPLRLLRLPMGDSEVHRVRMQHNPADTDSIKSRKSGSPWVAASRCRK